MNEEKACVHFYFPLKALYNNFLSPWLMDFQYSAFVFNKTALMHL